MTRNAPAEQVERTDHLLHELLFTLRLDRLELWSPALAGVPALDLHLLRAAAANPEALLGDIREVLGIPHSTLTSALNRLERRGTLKRRLSPSDRRSYRIALTAAGRRLQREHDRVDRHVASMVLTPLEEPEREQLLAMLGKVVRYWRRLERARARQDEPTKEAKEVSDVED